MALAMTLNVTIKQAGKKRPLTQLPVELPVQDWTLGGLIRFLVLQNVTAYNAKQTDSDWVGLLTQDAIRASAETGKVGFGRVFHEKKADPDEAVAAALLAFQDGLFRVFLDDAEITGLDAALALRDGSTAAFVRFTFLAGRMW